MRDLVWKIAVWLLVSAAMLLPIAWVEGHGFLSSATIQMWAKAIVLTDGRRCSAPPMHSFRRCPSPSRW